MTAPQFTGAAWTTEPGAIVFLPDDVNAVGFTDEEVFNLLTGGIEDGIVAAATSDVHTGAMIALVPTLDDVLELQAAAGPNAEPLEELHCTLLFLGEASEIDDDTRDAILAFVEEIAERQPVVIANIFGFNVWNPNGPEPCVVAAVSGADLDDVSDTVIQTLEDADIEYPDNHKPWVPHVTLAYDSDPVALLTDDLLSKTGPVTFDRIRVAFGGVTTDFPLGVVVASAQVFHLPGKHDQHAHGRGGAHSNEIGAAERMNAGKKLDLNDPEQARLHGTINSWSGGGNANAATRHEMTASVSDPMADTDGAQMMRVVAAAPANAPELHRGMVHVHPDDIPSEGHVVSLGPTSFTRSSKVAESFAEPEFSDLGRRTQVIVHVKKNSRALRVDQEVTGKFKDEQEHIGLGKYHVTSRKEKEVTIKAKDGKKRTMTRIDLEYTQVDDGTPATFRFDGSLDYDAGQVGL